MRRQFTSRVRNRHVYHEKANGDEDTNDNDPRRDVEREFENGKHNKPRINSAANRRMTKRPRKPRGGYHLEVIAPLMAFALRHSQQ